MTIVKTSELSGAVLNWAVAKALGLNPNYNPEDRRQYVGYPGFAEGNGFGYAIKNYSIDWTHGGPIIERERLEVHHFNGEWRARSYWHEDYQIYVIAPMYVETGPTFLVAAMRCYVASKLGDTVDVPDTLLSGV